MYRHLMLLSALGLVLNRAQATEAQVDFQTQRAQIVSIAVHDERGEITSLGSGVVYAPERVVTNCHVIRYAHSVKVEQNKAQFAAEWILQDTERDLCILRVAKLQAPPIKIRPYDTLIVGEAVYAVGNALGLGQAVSSGLVSVLPSKKEQRQIFTSAPISPGSSGGALFDSQARLVGITTASYVHSQNMNVAMPAEWIAEVAQRGVAPLPFPNAVEADMEWEARAEEMRQQNAWAALIEHTQKWLTAYPDASLAKNFRALALIHSQRLDEADDTLQQALKVEPNNAMSWAYLAQCQYEKGKKEEAYKSLQRSRALIPNSYYPHELLHDWHKRENNFVAARTEIQDAIRHMPSNAALWYKLAVLELATQQKADLAKAIHALKIAVHLEANSLYKAQLAQALTTSGAEEEAFSVLRQNTAQNQGIYYFLALAQTELRRKHYSDAEAAFKKVIEIDAQFVLAWEGLAHIYLISHKNNEAKAVLQKLLTFDPKSVKALESLGIIDRQDKHYESALTYFQKAIDAGAKDAAIWRHLFICQFELKQYEAATKSAEHLAQLPDALADDSLQYANMLLRQRRFDEALPHLERAERLMPQNANVLNVLANYYGNKGKFEKALAFSERSLAIDSSQESAWSNKGYTLIKLKHFDEAIAALETAIRLNPQSSNSWINMGEAQLRKGQNGQAIQNLERALELSPDAIDARILLCEAYSNTRQFDRARQRANEVLQKIPDFPPILGILTVINLVEKKHTEAQETFDRLKNKNPQGAQALKQQMIVKQVPGADLLVL